jgi:hypothetical protein
MKYSGIFCSKESEIKTPEKLAQAGLCEKVEKERIDSAIARNNEK